MQGKYNLPWEVNLPCVDWPFDIVLSKIIIFRFFKSVFGLPPYMKLFQKQLLNADMRKTNNIKRDSG